jgi:pyruvate formate lyase activating enzyme
MTQGGEQKVVGRDVSVAEVFAEVEKDRAFYRRSGGGMTLSGGESLRQPEFAGALLQICGENGIHTALESTACVDYKVIESILPYLDQFLLDIKHTDTSKHKEFTGRGNELIIENAVKIAASGKTELIIRVPVVPSFNDTAKEIEGIAKFAAGLPNVKKLHLLPYHRLGEDKYIGLGRVYGMGKIEPPTQEHMEVLLQAALKTGLECQTGG